MPPKSKKVSGYINLQIQAGAATPAPPVGPALGQHGVNIMEFVKAYNAATEHQRGNIIPVVITVFEDRSFTFITKTPPASELIKKAAGVQKGSGEPFHDEPFVTADPAVVAGWIERTRPDRAVLDVGALSSLRT